MDGACIGLSQRQQASPEDLIGRLARERKFAVETPDQVYAGDITYVWTAQGWLYVAVVIDLYSRKVVGWLMGRRLNSALVCEPDVARRGRAPMGTT